MARARILAFLLLLALCASGAASRPVHEPYSAISTSWGALSAWWRSLLVAWPFASQNARPRPPVWPYAFTAEYTFELPYVRAVQSEGLKYPVKVWYDGPGNRLRVDVYDGLDSVLAIVDTSYSVYPRINETACDVTRAAGPTRNLLSSAPLPDLSDGSWHYGGAAVLRGVDAALWTRQDRVDDKVSTYTVTVDANTGHPLRIYMVGFNTLALSHFDEYLLDFQSFVPHGGGGADDDKHGAAFDVPDLCADAAVAAAASTGRADNGAKAAATAATESRLLQAAALLPWAALTSSDSSNGATEGFRAHAAFVAAWNAARADADAADASDNSAAAPAPSFRLALNHLARYSNAQYAAIATAARGRAAAATTPETRRAFVGTLLSHDGSDDDHRPLPRHLDYRGTGADGIVKDQATCGSCWAFATTGTMQGAWHVATRGHISLSEQQLVDCSWSSGNNGCGGGWMEKALSYVADSDGAAAEDSYQYAGQNTFCFANATRPDAPRVARFAGYAYVRARDDEALMRAVACHGPVSVSIDASLPTFRYYSEGVFDDAACKSGADELDHAVLVVGYGTTDNGKDYWIVKNSWSTLWGESGYIKMARAGTGGNDCGVTTAPVLAVVAPEVHPRLLPLNNAASLSISGVPAPAPHELRFEEPERQAAWNARVAAAAAVAAGARVASS